MYTALQYSSLIRRPLRPRRVRTHPILPNKNLLIQPAFQYKQSSKKQQSKKTKRPNTFNKPGRLIRSQDRLAHQHAKPYADFTYV